MSVSELTDQDFVWGEMVSYWDQTGQRDALATWAGHADERGWRGLGYEISYGSPFGGPDPQAGSVAPWHVGLPSPWSDAVSSYWGEVTAGEDESVPGLGAGWSSPIGWGAV